MFNFFVLSWALTLGVVPQQQEYVGNSTVEIDSRKIATVAAIDLGVTIYDRFHAYTEMRSFQYVADTGGGFNPYRINYIAGADIYLTKQLTIGVQHECDHPVVSTINTTTNAYLTDYKYGKAETTVFVKIGNIR